jgi:hypothetical protein
MPAIDDLEVIRELLTGKPPSQDVNTYVKGRLTAAIEAAELDPGAGRPERSSPRSRRTVAEVVRRRRRLALRSAAVVAALAAGAVALVVVVVPGGTGGTAEAANVVKRVRSALSAAEPGEIAQMTVTTRSAAMYGQATTATTEEWSYGSQWRSVTYSAGGQPLYDEGFSTSSLYTLVSYQARTWARQSGLGGPVAVTPLVPGSRGCQPMPSAAVPLLFGYGLPGAAVSANSLPSTVARELRTAVSCGAFTADGRQRVNGIEALRLTSRPGSPISETIWVSPSTYLPVRVIARLDLGARPGRQQTANITWLPPTAQNLARLAVPIPAGFRRVPVAQAVPPILQQLQGGVPGKLQPRVTCRGPNGPSCEH